MALLPALLRCGQCGSTIPHCLDCLDLDNNYCRRCQEGFLPVDGLCLGGNASIPCTSHLGGTCVGCRPGYFLFHDGDQMGACVICSHAVLKLGPGCKDCVLVGGVPHCLACHSTYFGINVMSDSGATLLQCTTLSERRMPLQRRHKGLFVSPGQATCTVQNCRVCASQAPNICIQCTRGYSLKDEGRTCICGVPHCTTCSPTDGQQCTQCDANYALTPHRACVCSVRNCIQCGSQGTARCQKCITGYRLSEDGSTCSCGVDNCAFCSSTDGAQCVTCVTGYVQSYSQRSCTCAVEHCAECFPADGSQCVRCVTNYVLSHDFKVCASSLETAYTPLQSTDLYAPFAVVVTSRRFPGGLLKCEVPGPILRRM